MQGPGIEEEDGEIASINIIPLVDVVLVLLIIFMVTAVFSHESALKLDLPNGSHAHEPSQQPFQITVNVDKADTITVNNRVTKLEDLQTSIKSLENEHSKTLLVLRGDKDVVYGKIMPVLDEISQTGTELTLALKPNRRHNRQRA